MGGELNEPDRERQAAPARPKDPRFHSRPSLLQIVLFVLTIVSTYFTGYLVGGQSGGLSYSGALMAILVVHEMGHFVVSRRNRVVASWPYFIPMPFSPFGTMGAVIAIRSLWKNRRSLLDIGVAGPLAGFVLAVPALAIGLKLSTVHTGPIPGPNFDFGNSLLISWLQDRLAPPVPEGGFLVFHPLGFAGWVGLFVTWMNLLPVGQLDGGHVAYALLGSSPVRFLQRWSARFQRIADDRQVPDRWPVLKPSGSGSRPILQISIAAVGLSALARVCGLFGRSRPTFLGGIVFLALLGWGVHGVAVVGFGAGGASWFFLAGLILLFRFRHPPTQDDEIPLDRVRVLLSMLALAVFVITFVPIPVHLIE